MATINMEHQVKILITMLQRSTLEVNLCIKMLNWLVFHIGMSKSERKNTSGTLNRNESQS